MSKPFTLRPFCLGASLAACGPVGMLATSALVAHRGRGWIATDTAQLRGDVAIVLGANLRSDGAPGDMLKDRLAQGLRLYRLGRVPRIMISGFKPHSAVMHEWLLERGVPAGAIDADHHGNRTLLSMVNANERGYRSPVICTQAFHLPRALWLTRQMGHIRNKGCEKNELEKAMDDSGPGSSAM